MKILIKKLYQNLYLVYYNLIQKNYINNLIRFILIFK